MKVTYEQLEPGDRIYVMRWDGPRTGAVRSEIERLIATLPEIPVRR